MAERQVWLQACTSADRAFEGCAQQSKPCVCCTVPPPPLPALPNLPSQFAFSFRTSGFLLPRSAASLLWWEQAWRRCMCSLGCQTGF